ncbi:hypothetical protein B0H63DRAFT_393569 [Podospora didyma]|uniref:Glycosyltransferase Family 31 n=1 Tax=Podospora didyma TaxID=330526 RepID=A0AAE0NQ10_9PEZI|nr:hypothetical protein B0H63DRAFT_393569 [Podospora didyma]
MRFGSLARMPTLRSLAILALSSISLLALLVTSRRISSWSAFDEPYYPRGDLHRTHHAPQGTIDNATDGRHARRGRDPMCAGFPDTSSILVVLKTGASESFARVPTQLMTVLKCHDDFLIFSDMDQDIAGYRVHDSLDTVRPEIKVGNADFDLYRRQQTCLVDQESCNKLGNPSSEGWNLDKYKNIHAADKAFAMRPGYDWYLFIDADTYVLWPNLVAWLSKLKPTVKHYLGSVTLINDFAFGHGGSGYILSNPAMKEFVGSHPGIGNVWDGRAVSECCGDYVFALALNDTTSLRVKQVWPTINGEKPATLPFGPSHWCHPIVTMHHLNSEEISSFWSFERQLYHAQDGNAKHQPLLIRDIYDRYVAPRIVEKLEDWDNLSNDRIYLDTSEGRNWEKWMLNRMQKPEKYNEFEKKAHMSFEDCGAACKSLGKTECFQYKYTDGQCLMASSIRLGKPVKKESDEKRRLMSGWAVEKIDDWIKKQGSCSKVHWPEAKS